MLSWPYCADPRRIHRQSCTTRMPLRNDPHPRSDTLVSETSMVYNNVLSTPRSLFVALRLTRLQVDPCVAEAVDDHHLSS